MLIFKIKKQLPKLRVSCYLLPESKDDKDKFNECIKRHIENNNGIDDNKIDIFYKAIKEVSKEMNLIRTTKGFRKLKF